MSEREQIEPEENSGQAKCVPDINTRDSQFPKELIERFNSYWTPEPYSGCWLWISATKNGYGELHYKGKVLYCHRLSWEIHYGAIPAGKLVCHKCNTKRCVNPSHLYVGDNSTNHQDGMKIGAYPIGERCSWSKLTASEVVQIRQSKESRAVLGQKFGVHPVHISAIKRRAAWKHL